jgi:hypothetical protein
MPSLPLVRTDPRSIRRWMAKVDSYLLWAFNPQPPLRRSS